MTARPALAVAGALVATLVLASSSAALGSTSLGPTTTLSNDVVHNLGLATLTGSVPASQTVTVGIYLTNPNQAAEDAYVKQLYDPSSSNYGNFLDPDTFNSQFGVPAAKFQAAESWAQSQGLTVTPVETSTSYFLASGTAAQVAAAFATPLNTYTYARPRVLREHGRAVRAGFARSRRRRRPQQLQPLLHAACHRQMKHGGDRRRRRRAATTPNTGLLSPKDIASIYDVPSTNHGNGQSMAILGWGVTDSGARRPPQLRGRVGPSGACRSRRSTTATRRLRTRTTAAPIEWEMDTQASTGMAPNVTSETPLLRAPQHRRRHPRRRSPAG